DLHMTSRIASHHRTNELTVSHGGEHSDRLIVRCTKQLHCQDMMIGQFPRQPPEPFPLCHEYIMNLVCHFRTIPGHRLAPSPRYTRQTTLYTASADGVTRTRRPHRPSDSLRSPPDDEAAHRVPRSPDRRLASRARAPR